MKISCSSCGSSSVQKIDVLLATGTQQTVSEESKEVSGSILVPITLLMPSHDVKTGRKSISTTESDLVKLVRQKLLVFEDADKSVQEKYEAAIKEREEKEREAGEFAADKIFAPEYVKSAKITRNCAFALSAMSAAYHLIIGSGILSVILYAIVFGLIGFLCAWGFYKFALRLINPDLSRKITEQLEARENAKKSAIESLKSTSIEIEKPILKGEELTSRGYFCHTCGDCFIPNQNFQTN